MANIVLSPKAAKAVKKYSLDTCLAAFDYSRKGYGVRSIGHGLKCTSSIRGTNAALAAINAGREYTVFTTGRDDISVRENLHRSLAAQAQAESNGRPYSTLSNRRTHFVYSIHD